MDTRTALVFFLCFSFFSSFQLVSCSRRANVYSIRFLTGVRMRVDLSPRLGDTQWPINPPLLSSSHSPSFFPPPWNGVRSHSRCGTESRTELELAFHLTVTFLIRLQDYRVPTTPCTSRLKTKKTKNSFNLSRKYCMDKSSWYYSRNIGGTFVIMSPQSKYWGTCPPCPIGIDAPGCLFNDLWFIYSFFMVVITLTIVFWFCICIAFILCTFAAHTNRIIVVVILVATSSYQSLLIVYIQSPTRCWKSSFGSCRRQ